MTDPIGNCILAGVNGAGKSTLYEALNELKGMPRINTDEIVKERVKIRINKGGHGISEEDIERRYVETFKNLKDVLKYCDLAAFYDNTKNFHRFAIFRNGEIARISTILPTWFKEKELVCSTNLSVSVSDKLLKILPYHCKLHDFSDFFGDFFTAPPRASVAKCQWHLVSNDRSGA